MTKDVIALTERMPDPRALLAGLLAAGPDLKVQTIADGAVLQLCDDAGQPLVSIESPLLLQVPGEITRLLGRSTDSINTPAWWVEARASTAAPHAEHLAAAFASRLTASLGGMVWPPEAAIPTSILTSAPPADATMSPAPAAAQPAVDVLTERVAVVIQDRPVVAMTSWLSDAMRACQASGRGLQIVTPGHTRLTLPTRTMLTGPDTRWVIRDESVGYYDGLSGAVLRWRDGAFAPIDAPSGNTPVAASFAKTADHGDTQLIISFSTRHHADEQLALGGALETVWQTLTGRHPAGWGTAEPANLPWSRREITNLARRRAPEGTWLVVVGTSDRTAIATMRIARTSNGVEEDITLVVGYPAGEQPPLDALPELADELVAEHQLNSMLIQRRTARSDLSVPAHFEPLPIPIAYALGPEPVQQAGLDHARRPPIPAAPTALGTTARQGLFYPLGDGTSASSWTSLEQLMRHLRPPTDG